MSTLDSPTQTSSKDTAVPAMVHKFPEQIFVKGWRPGGSEKVLNTVNPFDDTVLAEIRQANITDVDEAYTAAAAAQPAWAARTPQERAGVLVAAADYMQEHFDELVELLSAESGSSATKAGIEVGAVIAHTREAATYPTRVHGKIMPSGTAGKQNYVFREPLGVVGVISPWNFPMVLTQRSVAPALALGNAVVLKPASDTPLTGGLLFAHVFEQAGLPRGLLNVLVGSGSEIGDHFVDHKVPSLISFTGSTEVGQTVGKKAIGGTHMKRVALELGGNAPFVVLDDADLDAAVEAAVIGKFLHQGQICMAINRIIVEANIYDEFVSKYAQAVGQLQSGDTRNPDNLVGPIINDQQVDSVTEKIHQARAEGAREIVSAEPDGRVIPPHVFADVTEEMELFREEIFGPVVGIAKAKDEADALRLANETQYGLSSAVFTQNIQRGTNFARGIKAGMTHINDITVNDEPHVMFGGEKNSGLGRFNGDWAIEEFTTDHWVGIKTI